MYAAKYDTLRYTFEASGSLWKDALVMRDRQTGSLWSQVYGVAIDGSKSGDTLELFPSEFITFAALKKKYPGAKMLKKDDAGAPGSYYKRYFEDPDRIGIFGHTFESEELSAKSLVLGVRSGRAAFAVPIDDLQSAAVALVEMGELVSLVYYDPANLEAFAVSISASDATRGQLTVDIDQKVVFDGQSYGVEELAGLPEFSSMPVITAYWFAWKSFFPYAEIALPNGVK